MSRLFTDEQLAALARTPHEQVRDALATGDDAVIRTLVASLERSFVGTVAGTRNWVTHTIAFIARERPATDLAELVAATQRFFAVYPDPTGSGTGTDDTVADLIADLAAR